MIVDEDRCKCPGSYDNPRDTEFSHLEECPLYAKWQCEACGVVVTAPHYCPAMAENNAARDPLVHAELRGRLAELERALADKSAAKDEWERWQRRAIRERDEALRLLSLYGPRFSAGEVDLQGQSPSNAHVAMKLTADYEIRMAAAEERLKDAD